MEYEQETQIIPYEGGGGYSSLPGGISPYTPFGLPVAGQPFSASRTETVRPHTLEGNFKVPAFTAGFSGLVVFAIMLVIYLFTVQTETIYSYRGTALRFNEAFPFWLVLVIPLLVTAGVFWWLVLRLLDAPYKKDSLSIKPAMATMEQAAPPVQEYSIKLDTGDGRHHSRLWQLPAGISHRQMCTMACGLLDGRGTGVAGWVGRGAPFSRAEFESLRDWLVKERLAEWKGKSANQGWELTDLGTRFMRILESESKGYAEVTEVIQGEVVEE